MPANAYINTCTLWDRLLFAAIQFSRIVSTVSFCKTVTRSRPRRRC